MLIGVIVVNPLKLDWQRQVALAVAVVALAYFFGHTVHLFNQGKKPTVDAPPVTPVQPAVHAESVENTTTGSHSPVVHNNSGTVIINNHDQTAKPQSETGISPSASLDLRPWMSLDVELVQGLDYDDKGWQLGTRYHTMVRYKIKNSGKTPAVKIDVFANMMPFTTPYYPAGSIVNGVPHGEPVPGTDVAGEIERMCKSQDDFISVGMGGTAGMLAPGQEVTGYLGLNGDSPPFKKLNEPGRMFGGNFVIVVAGTYGSTFDKSRYRVGKAFQLYRRTGSQKIEARGGIHSLN